ncbi:MAG: hypothetical protein CSB28_00330 [Desulfobacterales bacterium]|nr:MAG: hypothetical protein CSB28_00330 [Desulfobacterales bacterium]
MTSNSYGESIWIAENPSSPSSMTGEFETFWSVGWLKFPWAVSRIIDAYLDWLYDNTLLPWIIPPPDTDHDRDDYGDSIGTAGDLSSPSSITGNIETSRDRDWFRVSLDGGTTHWIDLEGSPSNKGSLQDPYLHGIYDSRGSRIAGSRDDDSGMGKNSLLEFTPDSDGYYYISVGASGNETGTYELSIKNDTTKVWWSVRDMRGFPMANHHFLRIEFDEHVVSHMYDTRYDFSEYIAENYPGNNAGFIMGAANIDGNLKFYCSADPSDATTQADLRSVSSFLHEDNHFHYEGHLLHPPEDMSNNEFVLQIVKAADNYQVNSEKFPVEYNFAGSGSNWENSGNCATWMNTLFLFLGFPKEKLDEWSEFDGIDLGGKDSFSIDYFGSPDAFEGYSSHDLIFG